MLLWCGKASLCGMTATTNCPSDMSAVSAAELHSSTGFTATDGRHYTMWRGDGGKPAPGQCNLSPGGGCNRVPDKLQTYLYTSYFASIIIVLAIVCTKTCSRK